METKNMLDGIRNIYQTLTNARSPLLQNRFVSDIASDDQLRSIYETGIGSKIIRLKAGHALNDTLKFETVEDEKQYERIFENEIKRATKFMLGFGRGLVVFKTGEVKDLAKPRKNRYSANTVSVKSFGGDMVTPLNIERDLLSPRYGKPTSYQIRGKTIHHTRTVDFTYYEPPEQDASNYKYGGISETQLIYNQLMNDAIVERASPAILEKNSTLFYKVKGLKVDIRLKREEMIKTYFGQLEDARSIYGAGLLDAEDEAFSVTQALTNLADVDQITLRRIAMVTGIPISILVGENVKGLNSSGENEAKVFTDTILNLESDYLLHPINQCMQKVGLNKIEFKKSQGQTAQDKANFDSKVIDNALKLWQMGEDYGKYLADNSVIMADSFDDYFDEGE